MWGKSLLSWVDCIGEFSKVDFEVLILVQSSEDSVHVALIYVFVILVHEHPDGIEVEITVVFRIKYSKARNGVKICLAFQGLLLFFHLNVVVNLFFNQPRKFKFYV